MDEMPVARRLLTVKVEGTRRPAIPRKNGLEKMNKDTRSFGFKTVAAAGWRRRTVEAKASPGVVAPKVVVIIKMALSPSR
jgi:hypothetical protein